MSVNWTKRNYKKHIRYDLRRNTKFRPIMLERYMLTNRYTDNIVWGPLMDNENTMDTILSMSPFDMATRYYDTMQQYDDIFMLRTVSRYSCSYLEIQITSIGTITDIHYDPNNAYTEQIKQINKLIDADLCEDLPLDLVLFSAFYF